MNKKSNMIAAKRYESVWNAFLKELLYQKRFERGTFEIPYFNPGKKACVMPYKTLSAIMSGISLKSVRYRKRLSIDNSMSVNT